METTRRLALIVGLFVLAAVGVTIVGVMLIGREQLWFEERRTYRAAFSDVGGLVAGATVRLGGRPVGIVSAVELDRGAPRERAVVVTFRIAARHAEFVRADSRARIGTQGLLGDKLVDVTLGSESAPEVPDGGWIEGVPPPDTDRLLATAIEAVGRARDLLARVDSLVADIAEDDDGETVGARELLAGLRRIVLRIEKGPGLAHELIYGEGLAEAVRRAAVEAGRAGDEVARVFGAFSVTEPAPQLFVNASRAAASVADAAGVIDRATLEKAQRQLGEIVETVRSGRGTLGGLIMDPTLYEETKRLLVNVRRNRILRALTRFAIAREEAEEIIDARPQKVRVRPRRAPGATKEVRGARPTEAKRPVSKEGAPASKEAGVPASKEAGAPASKEAGVPASKEAGAPASKEAGVPRRRKRR